MLNFKRQDKYGQELRPGDVCAYSRNDRVELVVYKGDSYGKTSGYGRFISSEGQISVKYTSVAFTFDPMGARRTKAAEVNASLKKYYEGI